MVSHIDSKSCLLQLTKSEKVLSSCDDLYMHQTNYYKITKAEARRTRSDLGFHILLCVINISK